MPIYAYRCTNCGHSLDALRKISDPALTVCPACGAATLVKQVTAAGFQLKGSGWYVTDFRGDKKAGKGAAADTDAGASADKKDGDAAKGDVGKGDIAKGDAAAKSDGGAQKPAAAPAAAPAPASAPAPAAATPAPAPPSKGGA